MRKFLAFLLTLTLLVQGLALPMAVAEEDLATATDIMLVCEACRNDPKNIVLSWDNSVDGTHVLTCSHGIALEKTRHDGCASLSKIVGFDDNFHYFACTYSGCDGKVAHRHKDVCTDIGTCCICDATGVLFEETFHNGIREEDRRHDEKYHWYLCPDCQEKVNYWTHSASCVNPGVCGVCGETDVIIEYVDHHIDYSAWEHDDQYHWQVCLDCGEVLEKNEHRESCANQGTCHVCDAKDVTFVGRIHGDMIYKYDDQYHWMICSECGEDRGYTYHAELCKNPGVCVECGARNVTFTYTFHEYDYEKPEYDNQYHWWVCTNCNEKIYKDEHVAKCQNPNVCFYCGATNVSLSDEMEHECDWNNRQSNETECWLTCLKCGEQVNKTVHADRCENPGICVYCDRSDVIMGEMIHKADHPYTEYLYNDQEHWFICKNCGERGNVGTHIPSKEDASICQVCGIRIPVVTPDPTIAPTGEPTATPTVNPTDEPTIKPTDNPTDEPTIKPTDEPTDEPTVKPTDNPTDEPTNKPTDNPTDEPTNKPTDKPTDEPTIKPTDKPTDEPTIKPTDNPTDEPTAEPTEAPTAQPTEQPAPIITEAPAHEHTFDIAFTSNNDGTHSKACLGNCGEVLTEKCQLVTTDMGLMTCTACATCGYAVYEAKAGVAALEEGKQVPAKVVRIEAAAIAPAPESAPEAVPADTALLVHETTFDLPVALSTELKGTVEKVFTAALVKDGQTIQPTGKVKLTIPVDEEALAQLEGKVLMLLREDGTLVEIAFEIVDGQLVFLTDELGVFLLMNPEA